MYNCSKVRRCKQDYSMNDSQEFSMGQPATDWNLRVLLCGWRALGAKLTLFPLDEGDSCFWERGRGSFPAPPYTAST